MERSHWLLPVGFGLLLLAGIVFTGRAPNRPYACRDCNVILISIDTFGAKHSTVYDPNKDTTPFLKELADTRGILFEDAYAQAPWTLPSHASLLTGRYPWDVNVWLSGNALPQSATTIAEMLHDDGYRTMAFSDGAFVQPEWHFDQGFDGFSGSLLGEGWNDLPKQFDDASAWIAVHATTSKPFFLFLRPFEVHDPYGVPGMTQPVALRDIVLANTKPGGATKEDAARFEKAYEADLRTTDNALRVFFGMLDTTGLSQNTIVIITADHGEEFGEHGTVGFHTVTTYDEVIHVPLMIVVPGAKAQRVSESVEIRSIPATILDIVGIRQPEGIATSLLPLVRGTEHVDRVVLSKTALERDQALAGIEQGYASLVKIHDGLISLLEATTTYTGSSTKSVIRGSWHVIQKPDGTTEVYDLESDPGETNNLFQALPTLPVSKRVEVELLTRRLGSESQTQ